MNEKMMVSKNLKAAFLVLMFYLPTATIFAETAKKKDTRTPALSIAELRLQLEKILQGTNTPGASVAIVRRDGPEWITGLGKSDLASHHVTTGDTLFRVGSISKGLVSLSILKLVNEAKLSLQDPVRKLVPEIWFENRWETTDPVRVVDLLEHTTGWDDMHLREYAKDAKGMTLREGLEYDHHSRVSRWRPGTRMAYCNSGPPVAAYIVEKLTGQRFEDYVTQNFFLPIGMKTATFFEQPSPELTTLYQSDGKTPVRYWNILERPAGAINASARDMAAYVQFYLNRGEVGGKQILPTASIERTETPMRTWAAQEGLKAGYGLGNSTIIHDGFVYHGHNGAVIGGLAEMEYLPEYGVGYYYAINTDNGDTFNKIGEAIRLYITRGFAKPAIPAASQLPSAAPKFVGWYEPDSQREEFMNSLGRLGLHRIRFEHDTLVFSNLTGTIDESFVPVDGNQFRYLPEGSPAEPIATVALLPPNGEGRFVEIGGTWKRVPMFFAIMEIAIALWFLLAIFSVLSYAPFWILGGLIKRRRRPSERALRLWPLIAVLSVLASFLLLVLGRNDSIARLGSVTLWSIGLFLATLIFGLASLGSTIALWRARNERVRKSVRWFSIGVTSVLLIVAAYFACWGVIGIRTWD